MLREAHLRKVFAIDDTTWLDDYLYAMLEEAWFARSDARSLAADTG